MPDPAPDRRPPRLEHVIAAADRIAGHVHRTPVLTCSGLDHLAGASLFFKCECLQKTGAFKARGATNAVLALDAADAARGVLTHSSGNHAAALARAASIRGLEAHIVMPRDASRVKRAAAESYGATIHLCDGPRDEAAAELAASTGAVLVHPSNDPMVIAGQGTAALELLDQIDDLDLVVTPVGGGGLLSGTALAVEPRAPGTRVVGAEPSGADDAFRSLQQGRIVPSVNPRTIADGLRTSLGDLTFEILRSHGVEIVTVDDQRTIEAMRLLLERMKLLVEPSSAIALAAVLDPRSGLTGRRIGIILSGGNVDLDALPWASRPPALP